MRTLAYEPSLIEGHDVDTAELRRHEAHDSPLRADGATAALRCPSSVLGALLPKLSVGVLVFAEDGSLVYMNAAARPLWSAAHSAPASSSLDSIVARGLLTGEIATDLEIVLDARDDAAQLPGRHLIVNAIALRQSGFEVGCLLVTIEDGTARCMLERVRPVIESLMRL